MNIAQARQQNPHLSRYTDQEILDHYASQLGMDRDHPRYDELRTQFLGRDRTWGEAIEDTARGVGQGLAAVGQFGGMIAGAIAPGQKAFDNPTVNAMRGISESLGEGMSPGFQARQAGVQQDTAVAGQRAREEGATEWGAAAREFVSGVGSRVRNPSVALHELAATAPTMAVGGPVGRVAQLGLRAAGVGARGAVRGGVAGGVAATSGMQGYEAGDETYTSLRELGVDHETATAAATQAMGASAAVSAGLSMLPGARTIERSMIPGAGRVVGSRAKAIARGAVAEGITEGIDEGFGAMSANYQVMPHDETRGLWDNVGEAAATGLSAGGGLGGVAAGLTRRPQVTTETGEKDLLNKEPAVDDNIIWLDENLNIPTAQRRGDDPMRERSSEWSPPAEQDEMLALEYDPNVQPTPAQLEHDPNVTASDAPQLPGRVEFRGDQAFYIEDDVSFPIPEGDVETYLAATGAAPAAPEPAPATAVDVAGPVVDPRQGRPADYTDLYGENDLPPNPYDMGEGLRTARPAVDRPEPEAQAQPEAATAPTASGVAAPEPRTGPNPYAIELPPLPDTPLTPAPARTFTSDGPAPTQGDLLATLRAAEQEAGVTRSAILNSGERVKANAPTVVRSVMNDRNPVGALEAMRDSGELTESQTALVNAWHAALTGEQAAPPSVPGANAETGFVPEPDPQVRAQLDAVRDGRKDIAIMDRQQAARLTAAIEGLTQTLVEDPTTGAQVVIVVADPAVAEQTTSRVAQVGMKQALGEAMGVVDPTQTSAPDPDAVTVQQVDDATGQPLADEVVPQARINEVTPIPGTTPRVMAPDQVLDERREGSAPAPAPVNTVNQSPEPVQELDPEVAAQDAALPRVTRSAPTEDIITTAENASGEDLYNNARYELYRRWDKEEEGGPAQTYLQEPGNELTEEERRTFMKRYDDEQARAKAKKGGKRRTKAGAPVAPALLAEIESVAQELAAEPPAQPAAEPAPVAESVTDTVPEWAQNHANDVAGEVVYVGNGTALIAGHSALSGQLVYAAASETAGRTRVDIDKYTGDAFTPAQLKALRAAKKEHVAEENRLMKENPDGPFLGGSNMAVTSSVDPRLGLLLDSLMKELNLDGVRVFLLHPSDVRGNRQAYNLHGRYASAASAGMDYGENGSTRTFGARMGDHYISLDPNLSPEMAVETLAHELGHIIEKTALLTAPAGTRNAIKKEYEKWLASTQKMSPTQIVGALRNAATAHATLEGMSDDVKLNNYWTSFSEWFADNVSKWVTTSKKPSTLVDRFFQKVSDQIRKLAAALGGKKYIPAKSVAAFLDAMSETGDPQLASILNRPAPGPNDPLSKQRASFSVRPAPASATPPGPGVAQGFAKGLAAKAGHRLPSKASVSGATLPFMSLRQISEQHGSKLPAMRDWIGHLLERSSVAGNIANEASATAKKWRALKKQDSQNLSDVLLGATLAEIEVDNRTQEYFDSLTADQQAEHKRLVDIHDNKLSDAARKIRRESLAVLKRQWDYTHKSLKHMLDHTIADPKVRGAEIAKLDAIFNARRGDYFPLSRFGEHIVIARGGGRDGRDTVSFHESSAAAAAEKARLLSEGITDVTLTVATARDAKTRPSTGFVADMHKAIDSASGSMDAGTKAGLHEALQRIFAESLPEISGAKRLLRREGVEGFSRDARRGFADAVARGSRYAAQLDFAPRIQAAMESAENQTRSTERRSVAVVIGRKEGFPAKAGIVEAGTSRYKAAEQLMADGYTVTFHNTDASSVREHLAGELPGLTEAQRDKFVARAHEIGGEKSGVQDMRQAKTLYNHMVKLQSKQAMMDPSQLSEFIGKAGYVWFLGFTPAFLFMNLMQNPMIGLPYLGARFGTAKTAAEWGKAASWFSGVRMGKLIRDRNQPFTIAWLRQQVESGAIPAISKDELDMLQSLEDQQLIDFTQARDLSNVGSNTDGAWERGLSLAAAGAHHVEVFNRVTFALANYRLAKKSSASVTHAQAARAAEDGVAAVHFDYSPTNKPEFMRGNIARPIFMFQQYRQNLLYFWAKTLKDSFAGETPEVKSAARKGAFLMGATTLTFAGTMGMPFVGAIQLLADLLMGDEDDDEPYDFEAWVKSAADDAEKATGVPGLGATLHKGIFAAMGMNIGQRIGQADILPFLNEGSMKFETGARDKARAYMFDMLGPVGSVLADAAGSIDAFDRGDVVGGMAQMTPKFIADGLRAYDLSQNGVRKRNGDELVAAEAFDGYDILLQASGIMPLSVASIRSDRGRVIDIDQQLQQRTRVLTNNFVESWQRSDRAGINEAVQAIQKYNKVVASGKFGKNPDLLASLAITGRKLEQSIRSRQQQAIMRHLTGGTAENRRQLLLAMQVSGLMQDVTPESLRENATRMLSP